MTTKRSTSPIDRRTGPINLATANLEAGSQLVLMVVACTGTRCTALRRLACIGPAGPNPLEPADPAHEAYSPAETLLRHAVRDRPNAVLVSVPCLGPCQHASVAAVGPGLFGRKHFTWLERPAGFGLTDRLEHAKALADWIAGTAPDKRTIPNTLRYTRL